MSDENLFLSMNVKRIRLNLGLTQEEFAKLFNASKGNVSMWESGKATPRPKRLKQLADLDGVDVLSLFKHC